ncbi:hypothetical protein Lal_00009323 [Lupinus albus]|nr:hypothetical protein Lal_00009323 [Lupinus albus]
MFLETGLAHSFSDSCHASCKYIITRVTINKNFKRSENKNMNLLQAQSTIMLATSLAGNDSKLLINNSVSNFVILQEFKVKQNFQKAPRIKEVVWLAPQAG